MRILVKSLKRLYSASKVMLEKLEEMLTEGKINQEEFDYIVA